MLLIRCPEPAELVLLDCMAMVFVDSACSVVRALDAATFPAGDTEVASLLLPKGLTWCECAGKLRVVKVVLSAPAVSPRTWLPCLTYRCAEIE